MNICTVKKRLLAIIKRNLHNPIVSGAITSFCILAITAEVYMGVHLDRMIRSSSVGLDKQKSHPRRARVEVM